MEDSQKTLRAILKEEKVLRMFCVVNSLFEIRAWPLKVKLLLEADDVQMTR